MSKLKPSLPTTTETAPTITGSTDTAVSEHKSSVEMAYQPSDKEGASEATTEKRDMVLSHKEAQAGSPADVAACGEEDPGSGLEFLVTKEE